jgi:hypothetical protein
MNRNTANYILRIDLHGRKTWSFTLKKTQIEGVWEQSAEENIYTDRKI